MPIKNKELNKNIRNKDLKRRIISLSYKHKLSHLGSCLTAVDIIKEIYDIKKVDEKFILSCGHAALALYCVIEATSGRNAEEIFNHHGVHPDRCASCGLDCSTGSLGHGLPISVGMALADRTRNVYCLISDGEAMEGSIWEAMRIMIEQDLTNLKIYLNLNSWGAYGTVSYPFPKEFDPYFFEHITNVNDFPFLQGQDAHYHIMTEEEYMTALEILK